MDIFFNMASHTSGPLAFQRAPEVSKATRYIYKCYDLSSCNRCLANALKTWSANKKNNMNNGLSKIKSLMNSGWYVIK